MKKNDNQGLMWVPYIMVEKSPNEPPDKEYEEFMTQYEEKHKCCPKCGSLKYSTTLMGYILNMDKKDEYKDKNDCTCLECGDNHIYHDRIEKSL